MVEVCTQLCSIVSIKDSVMCVCVHAGNGSLLVSIRRQFFQEVTSSQRCANDCYCRCNMVMPWIEASFSSFVLVVVSTLSRSWNPLTLNGKSFRKGNRKELELDLGICSFGAKCQYHGTLEPWQWRSRTRT
jgi:hypothetical protein